MNTHDARNEHQKYYIELRKTYPKSYNLYNSILRKFSGGKKKFIVKKISVVSGVGEMENDLKEAVWIIQ